MKRIIIFLARKDITIDQIKKFYIYSIVLFTLLLLIFGLNWQVDFKNPIMSIKLSKPYMNTITWWSLILTQNCISFFHMKYIKSYFKTLEEYRKNLLQQKKIILAYSIKEKSAKELVVGSIYNVFDIYTNNSVFSSNSTPNTQTTFNGYSIGDLYLDSNIFKFVSLKEHRKLKLKKLKKSGS